MILNAIQTAWREARPLSLLFGSLTVLGLLSRRRWLTGIGLLLFAWLAYFFRDPERTPDSTDPLAILSPADGRVMAIEIVEEPYIFQTPMQRITIFLSVFDVHVQRAPYQGTVQALHYQPGKFLPAFLKGADENESNLLALETAHGPLGITQMTGLLARRIVCWPTVGHSLERGQQYGLIKFGSRVDLYLPDNAAPAVEVGQHVYGGQTVMARWQSR